jgi:hypothetical protein
LGEKVKANTAIRLVMAVLIVLVLSQAVLSAKSASGVNITAPSSNQSINATNTFSFTCSPIIGGSGGPNNLLLVSQYCDSFDCSGTVTNLTISDTNNGEVIALQTGGDGNPKTGNANNIGNQDNTAVAYAEGTAYARCKVIDLSSGSCTGDGCVSINTRNISVADNNTPTIALLDPANDSWSNVTVVNLSFSPSDLTSGISACNLIINDAANQSNTTSITEDIENNISVDFTHGSFNWTVNCTDTSASLNNATNLTFKTLNIDTVAPNVTLDGPDDSFLNTSPNITFSFTLSDDVNLSTNTCSLYINSTLNQTNSTAANGTTAYFTVNNINHGPYQWNVSCYDSALNTNFSSTREFEINITPAIISISDTPDPIKGGNVITINASGVDDPNNDTLNLYCDTTTTPTAASTNCTGGLNPDTGPPYEMSCTFATGTTDVENTIYCRVYDGRDYSPALSTTYTTDSTPPSTTITIVANDLNATYYDSVNDGFTNMTISGEANMECRVGTSDVVYSSMSNDCAIIGTLANCSQVTTTQGADAYNFYVSCRDSLENEQSTSQNNDITSLVHDWTAPTTSDDSSTDVQSASYTVTISEADNVDGDPDTLYCTDTAGSCSPTTTIDDAGTVTFTTANRGLTLLRYNSTDDAGNVQETTNVSININLLANFTKANDSVVTVKGGSSVTILGNFTDKDNQTMKFYVCKSDEANATHGCNGAGNEYCSNTTELTNASCALTTESDDVSHTWYAFVFDSLNESAFENHTGSYTSDSTAPSITISSPANTTHTQNVVTASVTLGEAAIEVSYSLDGAANVSMDKISDTVWSATVSSIANGGHEIVFYANDSVNNTGIASRKFSTDDTADDTTAPTITVRSPVNNTIFNKTITSILLNLTTDENVDWAGYVLDDSGSNVSMDNISRTSWNITLTDLADGDHNVTFYANDTSSNLNTGKSAIIFFSTDGNSPLLLEFNTTPLTGNMNETVNLTIFSHWNDSIGLSHGLVEENSSGIRVNHTINLSGTDDWVNFTLDVSEVNPGQIVAIVYVNDTTGNFNNTIELVMNISDVSPPEFNITYIPTDSDSLDPDSIVNVTANVSDYSNVTTTILQFKEINATEWSNFTMTHSGDNVYIGNFTPTTTNNWSFQVYSNDSFNNANTSLNTTLEIRLEESWKIIGFGDNESSALLNTNKTIGTFKINNTGDFDLNFDLSYTPATISIFLNRSEPFNLTTGLVEEIEVNVTALSTETTTDLAIKVDANATAVPDFDYANITFVSTTDGAFLLVTIQKPEIGATATVGDTGINLTATVKNVGTQDANGVWLLWTLPSSWTNNSVLNRSIGFLGVGESGTNILTADIGSEASTGVNVLFANASSTENRNGSTSREITLGTAAVQEDTTESVVAPSGGGGSGGSSGGGGGVSLERTIEGKTEVLNTSETFELVRGEGNSFPLAVTNIFEEATLYNVTVEVDGFLEQYLSTYPSIIYKINPGETRNFEVTITSPKYQQEGSYELGFTITGKIIGVKTTSLGDGVKATSYLRKDLVERRHVTLIIHDISREDALLFLDEAKKDFEEVVFAEIPATKIQKLLDEALAALEAKQYSTVNELSVQIREIRNSAFEANELLETVGGRLAKAEEDGLSVVESKRLFNLAFAAFEREDFETAILRAKDAQFSLIIETKGKVNYVVLLKKYWPGMLGGLVILAILSYIARRKMALVIISRRLEDFAKEVVTINQLMEEAQTKTYKEKTLSTAEYHKLMFRYESRLDEIRKTQMKLRSKKTNIIRISDEINNLVKEQGGINEEIKKAQTDYYSNGKISKKKYERLVKVDKLRKLELEKAIAILETKLAKKEKLGILKEAEQKVGKHLKNVGKKEELKGELPEKLSEEQIEAIDKKIQESRKHRAPVFASLLKNVKKVVPEQSSVGINERKEVLGKLRDQFKLDKVKEKIRVKAESDYEADAEGLEEYGFKVKIKPNLDKKKSVNQFPTKEHILKKLKEVHQNG